MFAYNISENAKDELESLPRNYTVDLALENVDVLYDPYGRAYNASKLDEFIYNVENRVEDKIRITTFGIDGPPVISILEFDGDIIKYTIDDTRYGSNFYEIRTAYGSSIGEHIDVYNNQVIKNVYINTLEDKELTVFTYANGFI